MDQELKKAFMELQKKRVETQAQMNICEAQIHKLFMEEKKNELTTREVISLPDDVRLYESVGRMFLLQPKKVVLKNLEEEKHTKKAKAKELEAKKTYLLRSVQGSEENLREMVSQRRK